jgi:hypothetical protein
VNNKSDQSLELRGYSGSVNAEWDRGVMVLTGTAALASGAVLAYAFMPSDVSDPGGLFFVALCVAVSLLLGPAAWATRNPMILVSPVSMLSLGLVYWILLDLLQFLYVPEVWNVSDVYAAFATVSLFAFGVYCGYFLPNARLPKFLLRASIVQMSSRSLFIAAMIAAGLSFLRFAIPSEFNLFAMIEALGAGRWNAPWARGDMGGWDAFLDHMAYFGYVLPSLVVMIYRSEGRITYRTMLCLVFALIIGAFLAQGGGRRIVGATWGAAVVLWILSSKQPIRAMIVTATVLVPLMLLVMQFMLHTRNVGVADAYQLDEPERPGIAVDDNFNRMAQTISLVPSEFPHVGMDYVLWVVVRPVPRILWAGKPMNHGFDLTAALGKSGVSLTTSVVGESYLAFSYIGCVVVGVVYGYLGALLWAVLQVGRQSPSGLIIYAAGLFALFVGLRSAIELVLFSYVILGWLVVLYMVRRMTKIS